MQAGNVAAVEALFAAFARRDTSLDATAYDPEVVWDSRGLADAPDIQGVYRGYEGMRSWWRAWLAAWDSVELVGEPTHVAIGSQVLSCWRQRNRGRGSGLEVELEVGIVWTFERGLIVRAALFPSHAEARAAAGTNR